MIAALSVALISCGGSEEESNGTDETNTTDSTEVVEETLLDMEMSDFVNFEDYGKIETRAQLYDIWGAENLKDDTAWFAEGTVMFMCTDLVNPENGWRVRYVFDELEIDTVSFIESNYHNWSSNYEDLGTQKVEASNGLYTGMPLSELVEWNGGDFDFSGFGWDYEGGISASEGSKIADSKVMVSLTMDVGDGLDQKYQGLYGDMMMNSADGAVEGAPIVVSYMSYYVRTFE